jgi:hypothetical protein
VLGAALPKSYGTCKTCKQRFFVKPDQELFGSILLNREQNDQLKDFYGRLHQLRSWGTGDAAIREETQRARATGAGAVGALDGLRRRLAGEVLKSVRAEHQGIGPEGAIVVLETIDWIKHVLRHTNCELALADIAGDVADLHVQFKSMPAYRDVAWRAFQRYQLAPPPGLSREAIQHAMAWHLYLEGKDCQAMQQRAFATEAKRYALEGYKHLVILSGSCKACARLDNRRIAIEKFLAEPCIPCERCDNDQGDGSSVAWCNCCLSPALDDD